MKSTLQLFYMYLSSSLLRSVGEKNNDLTIWIFETYEHLCLDYNTDNVVK